MAKGHTLLKKLRAEKAKVKLKGSKGSKVLSKSSKKTKFLPKGTNVTDTSFKVKQIVVREQLKVSFDGELLSKRKLNIKELLTRLQHYNTTVRTDGVNGLKELITLYPEQVVMQNLYQLLQGVSHLVLDKEKIVRREALKLIAMILIPVSTEKIAPFFDILCSYLRCAMTHIDTNIQEDSLLLLDNLLAAVPSLVAVNSNKILPNFFDLISKLRSDAKPGRTLTVNLGSKITSVKWRVKVLNRLYGILDAIVMEKVQKNRSLHTGFSVQTINFDPKENTHIPIYRNDYVQYSSFKLQDSSNKRIDISTTEYETDVVKYIEVLVPMLFETWLEVGPGSKIEENNLDSTLSEEAASVLNCILNIFQLLWKFIKIYENDSAKNEIGDKFISKYGRDFSNFILKLFPYTQSTVRKRKRNDKDKSLISDSICTIENLMICNLFCIFNKKLSNDWQIGSARKVTKYVQTCLSQKSTEHKDSFKQMLLVLDNLLLDVSKTWLNAHIDVTKLVDAAIKYYENNRLSENMKCDLFNILCELVHHEHLNRTPHFQVWLSTLPELLLQPEISEKIVNIMCILAKQKNSLFTNSLLKKYSLIIHNLPHLKIAHCDDKYPVIFKIIGIFYWVPIYDAENLDTLKEFLKNNTDEVIGKYFKNLLQLRYELRSEPIVLKYLENEQ